MMLPRAMGRACDRNGRSQGRGLGVRPGVVGSQPGKGGRHLKKMLRVRSERGK